MIDESLFRGKRMFFPTLNHRMIIKQNIKKAEYKKKFENKKVLQQKSVIISVFFFFFFYRFSYVNSLHGRL